MSMQRSTGPKRPVRDPGGCHYLPHLLAVRLDEKETAIETLGSGGFKVRDASKGALGRVIRDFPEGLPLGVLHIGDDPHRGSRFLANLDRPIAASPIHGVGYEGHGGYMSGAGHGPTRRSISAPGEVEIEGMIAVIDSGIVKTSLRPHWMGPKFIDAEAVDIESVAKGAASHGTFVSSVIRKLAPSHGIAFAAARPDIAGRLESRHKDRLDDPPTDELEVLGAVARLVRRFGDRPSEIGALNLSLGAIRCGPQDSFLLTLQTALDMWRRFFGYDVPIFAAGGNSTTLEPVYPAAFPWVRAVAAAQHRGDQVVWQEEKPRTPLPPRSWITDIAPGVKIHGLSGVSKDDTVWWSGSSFATAIATSQSVTGQSFEVDATQTYWPNRAVDYGGIPDLAHG